MKQNPLASRSDVHIVPDSSRVVALLFVAGQELGGAESRASSVVKRIVALPEPDVRRRLKDVIHRFARRHRDIVAVFSQHAERVSNRLDPKEDLSEERWLLLGASFTHEYSLEAAAVCNPSIVAHPDQSNVPEGAVRFVMSFRGVGEGHRSSIGFRTGLVSADGAITLDPRGPFPMIGTARDGLFHRDVFHARLKAMGQDGESAAYVLDELPVVFSIEELEARLEILISEFDTRQDAHTIARHHRSIAACSYAVYFDDEIDLSERVLWPVMSAEAHGMEDARFVLFTETDGSTTYLATYTAFDGVHISQQLLRTDDFLSFDASPVVGAAAVEQGSGPLPASRSTGSTPRSRDTTARPTRSASRTRSVTGDGPSPSRCRSGTGRSCSSATAAHRSRPSRRLAGAHARGRPDAHLQHRRGAARPRRSRRR